MEAKRRHYPPMKALDKRRYIYAHTQTYIRLNAASRGYYSSRSVALSHGGLSRIRGIHSLSLVGDWRLLPKTGRGYLRKGFWRWRTNSEHYPMPKLEQLQTGEAMLGSLWHACMNGLLCAAGLSLCTLSAQTSYLRSSPGRGLTG